MREARTSPPKNIELQQHFQNYFELLLGTERARLQRVIALGEISPTDSLSNEVELRITYLKGAVRMAKLLCLINTEEAKLKHEILMSERESLLAHCVSRQPVSPNA
jgi:hypothetical protein